MPIIIVPATTSSIITVYNAVDFLQDYKYIIVVCTLLVCNGHTTRFISVEEKKSNCKKRETEVMLQRRRTDQSGQMVAVPYQVLDNPLRLTASDW